MRIAVLLGVGLALGAPSLEAQAYGRGSVRCSAEVTATNVVGGHLVPRTDSIFISRGVSLARGQNTLCQVSSDSTGAFEFAGVPRGTYRVEVAGLGLEPIAPITVHVTESDSVLLAVPVGAADQVSECVRDAACASVLSHSTLAEHHADAGRSLSTAGYRIGIAMSREAWGNEDGVTACVPDEFAESLREVFDVAPASECISPRLGDQPRRRLRHAPSGRDAVGVTLDQAELTGPGTAVIHVSYFVASLWAAGFRCSLEFEHGLWVPVQCRLTWVS